MQHVTIQAQNESRNIPRRSNAACAQNVSPGLTICDPIYVLVPMNGRLSVQYVEKLLRVNMIGNATKACIILVRSRLYVKASSKEGFSGDVFAALLVPMQSAGIFDQKQVVSASSPC
jgi:hypothetical protein